jgi:hypothetical protein
MVSCRPLCPIAGAGQFRLAPAHNDATPVNMSRRRLMLATSPLRAQVPQTDHRFDGTLPIVAVAFHGILIPFDACT